MAFDAGSVYATLGGRFNKAGFHEFSSAMYKARAEMTATEKRQQEMAARSSESMQKMGHAAKVIAGGAIVGLTVATGLAIKQAVDFEKSMRNVNSIAQLSEKQFRAISRAVLDMAGKTGQSPKTLAEGLYQLVSSGFKAQDSLKILHASAIAATAGLTTTEVATTAVAAALNAYHLPASKAQQVSDTLFQTVNRGVITFEELSHTIGLVLPFANSLHVPLNQVGAAIATLTKEGIPAAEATTYLKNAMVTFLKPSDALKKAIKETGAASGEALVRQKGFQGALEAVAAQTDGTKGALQKLFPDIRASAAAFALTGTNAKTAEGDVRAFKDTAGATNKVFQEQSKSTAVQWQKFLATLQADAVKVGSVFLPLLSKGLAGLGQWLSGINADQVGHSLAAGFSEAGHVLSGVFGVAKDVAGALLDIAKALDLGDPTKIEAILAAIVGFKVASTVAPMVSTLASAIGDVILNARSAPTLAAFFADLPFGPIGLIATAVAGLAAGLVLLGGSETTEEQLARNNAEAHKAVAAAIRDQARAAEDAANKGLGAQRADLNLRGARQGVVDARQRVGQAEALPDRGDGSRVAAIRQAHQDLANAILNEKQAYLDAKGAHDAYNKSVDNQTKLDGSGGKVGEALNRVKKAQDLVRQLQNVQSGVGGRTADPRIAERNAQNLAKAQKALTDRTREYIQTAARANVGDTNRNRLMNATKAITEKNVQGVSKLIESMQGLPKQVQTKLLLQNQDALAKAGDLSQRLTALGQHHFVATVLAKTDSAQGAVLAFRARLAGVPAKKIVTIIQNAKSKQDEVDKLRTALANVKPPRQVNIQTTAQQRRQDVAALQSQIDALHGKTIDIFEVTHHKTVGGKAAGGKVGMAAGGKTNGPQMYLVGEDPSDPVEWIIPRNRKYRGRALGLLQDAMEHLLPHAASGATNSPTATAAGHHRHPPIGMRTYLKLSPDEFQADRDHLQQKLDNLKQHSKDKDAKGHLSSTAVKDKKKIPGVERELAQAKKVFKLANRHANLIQARLDNAQIAATNMQRFDTISQETGKSGKPTPAAKHAEKQYLDAVKTRLKFLGMALAGLEDARQYAKPGSKWDREVRQNIADVRASMEELHGAKSQGQQDAESAAASTKKDAADQAKQDAKDDAHATADTGMTKTERDQFDALEAQLAVAQLTTDTVEGPGEDIDVQTQIKNLVEKAFGEISPGGARAGQVSSAGIASLAGQVKQARDDLTTLTKPDVTADQQAVIDQANARISALEEGNRTQAALLTALSGPGDITTGGGSAGSIVQNNYMLHPGDPKTLRAIGDAAVSGMNLQPSSPAPRERLGV